jgi:hypothetical protein
VGCGHLQHAVGTSHLRASSNPNGAESSNWQAAIDKAMSQLG